AFWGNGQMVFGDGDGKTFNDFTTSVDVIGHELSHGVIEKTADLVYFFQSGALNESIADVFGTLVKQHYLKQKAEEADWMIGSELLGKDVKGVGSR
ncbi:M4 family metallopeptidase, partial [Enterobacter hormaechei]|nr:M4 family metallopeptidase [Enterobacter hormaechei]